MSGTVATGLPCRAAEKNLDIDHRDGIASIQGKHGFASHPATRHFIQSDRAAIAQMGFTTHALLRTSCFVVLLSAAPLAAIAETSGKVPREVIDHAAAHGKVSVLVGLKVRWQMESSLSEDLIRQQREAIGSVQVNLLRELAGTQHTVIRRYEEVPGLALEVGADALATLARSTSVVNVLLDRPAARSPKEELRDSRPGETVVEVEESVPPEKVPRQLFRRVASDGTVLVLAGLRAPWQREEILSKELVALQRSAILNAQSYVLAELAGTDFRVMRLYREIPGIALRVGLDALKVLEMSPAVTNVLPDRPPSR
jgi:hypothetical protein